MPEHVPPPGTPAAAHAAERRRRGLDAIAQARADLQAALARAADQPDPFRPDPSPRAAGDPSPLAATDPSTVVDHDPSPPAAADS